MQSVLQWFYGTWNLQSYILLTVLHCPDVNQVNQHICMYETPAPKSSCAKKMYDLDSYISELDTKKKVVFFLLDQY